MTADNGSMNSSCSSCDCGQVWSFCVAVCALLGYSSTRTYHKTFANKNYAAFVTVNLSNFMFVLHVATKPMTCVANKA